MKKLMVYGVLVLVISMVHAETVNLNFASTTTSSSSGASESDTVKSVGRGVGINETEALKDAYRDAIERAIGLYVDAETVAKNDEIVKDQILTQSNAYITHYDKIKTTNISGGLVEVRIVATVKKRALTTKVSESMPGGNFSLGSKMQDLHAKVSSKDKRNLDGAALLRNVLSGLNPIRQLLKPKICVETQNITDGGQGRNTRRAASFNRAISKDEVGVSYIFKIEFDYEKYFKEFIPKLKTILDQISLEPPKEFRVYDCMYSGMYNLDTEAKHIERSLKEFLQGEGYQGMRGSIECSESQYGFRYPMHVMSGSIKGVKFIWNPVGVFVPSQNSAAVVSIATYSHDKEKGVHYLALIVEMNEQKTSGKAILYALDQEASDVMYDWQKMCGGEYGHATSYSIVFSDAQGSEIMAATWQIHSSVLLNTALVNLRSLGYRQKSMIVQGAKVEGMFYVTPFVGCAGESFMQWQNFIFQKDDLAKIKQVRIEPAD